jgi:hypothetical protein
MMLNIKENSWVAKLAAKNKTNTRQEHSALRKNKRRLIQIISIDMLRQLFQIPFYILSA